MTDAVAVAYVHANEVAYSWHHSMVALLLGDLKRSQPIRRGGIFAIRCPSAGLLAEARNRAVRHFLDGEAGWLWFVDTDMGFAPDTVTRLLDAADPDARPVVGGLCFASREVGDDGWGGQRTIPAPTIFDWHTDDTGMGGFRARAAYERDAVTRCDGTGAACLLVHRGVLERMAGRWGPSWFDRIQARDGSVGEDLSFCMRAMELGVPVHVHTGVRTTHLKGVWLAEEDYLVAIDAEPADGPVAEPVG